MGEHKKWRKTVRQLAWVAALAAALLLLFGCCEPNTLAKDHGRSVHNNLAQQMVNPQAGQDLTPAVGLDPKAGQAALDKYDKSFKAEEKKMEFKLLTQY